MKELISAVIILIILPILVSIFSMPGLNYKESVKIDSLKIDSLEKSNYQLSKKLKNITSSKDSFAAELDSCRTENMALRAKVINKNGLSGSAPEKKKRKLLIII